MKSHHFSVEGVTALFLLMFAASSALSADFWLEAENTCVHSALEGYANPVNDPDASNNAYILSQDHHTSQTDGDLGKDRVTFRLNIGTAGAYKIWFRINNNNSTGDDSWFYRRIGGNYQLMNGTAASGWVWIKGASDLNLVSGLNDIEVANRENGLKMDKLYLTTSAATPSGLGDPATGCSDGGSSPPVANFVCSPLSGPEPLNVSCTDQSTNSPTSWSWNFGDGGNSTQQNPTHSFNQGTYTVSLTATNAAGSDDEVKSDYITVTSGGGGAELLNEGFESGMGGFVNATGDHEDWRRNEGGTVSNPTGPSSGANGSTWYMYLETSSCCAYTVGETAFLESPEVDGSNRTLTFYYHMFGSDIGTLNVDVDDGSWHNGVWSETDAQHTSSSDAYTQASVDLSSYSGPIKIRFRAVAAGGYLGDIAIDDVVITDGGGGVPQPPTVSITSPNSGASFTAPAVVTVTVAASDVDGSVSIVELRNNGSSVGTDNSPPYEFTLNGLSAGSYTLEAMAEDNDGAISTTGIFITVSSGGAYLKVDGSNVMEGDLNMNKKSIINSAMIHQGGFGAIGDHLGTNSTLLDTNGLTIILNATTGAWWINQMENYRFTLRQGYSTTTNIETEIKPGSISLTDFYQVEDLRIDEHSISLHSPATGNTIIDGGEITTDEVETNVLFASFIELSQTGTYLSIDSYEPKIQGSSNLGSYTIAPGVLEIFDHDSPSFSMEFRRGKITTRSIDAETIEGDNIIAINSITAGEIHTDKWNIDTPDYVFKPGYNLPSLEKVEAFVKKNRHLPEIPSAKEFEKRGMDLAAMNMRLLKKVEELTLYAIQQNKRIAKQHKRITQLENEFKAQNIK